MILLPVAICLRAKLSGNIPQGLGKPCQHHPSMITFSFTKIMAFLKSAAWEAANGPWRIMIMLCLHDGNEGAAEQDEKTQCASSRQGQGDSSDQLHTDASSSWLHFYIWPKNCESEMTNNFWVQNKSREMTEWHMNCISIVFIDFSQIKQVSFLNFSTSQSHRGTAHGGPSYIAAGRTPSLRRSNTAAPTEPKSHHTSFNKNKSDSENENCAHSTCKCLSCISIVGMISGNHIK